MRGSTAARTLRIAIAAFFLFRTALTGFFPALAHLASLLLSAHQIVTREISQYYLFFMYTMKTRSA
jgi:hypothetical protein